jgi:hypothetical protein
MNPSFVGADMVGEWEKMVRVEGNFGLAFVYIMDKFIIMIASNKLLKVNTSIENIIIFTALRSLKLKETHHVPIFASANHRSR